MDVIHVLANTQSPLVVATKPRIGLGAELRSERCTGSEF